MSKERTYSEPEIAERLASLTHWTCAEGALQRRFKTAGFKATLMVVNAIGHLCEAAWHHPEMVVGYDQVVVKLSTHSARGITDKDFELAAKIESLIAWQPACDGGALTGPPDSPGHAYIRYE